jgi:hypothetical protein
VPGQTLTEVAVEVSADLSKLKPTVIAASREAGDAAGKELGDGITKGADGKLRDARGKFAAAGKSVGKETGKGFDSGFGDTFVKTAATMASKFALIGGAAAAASPGVLQLAGALAPAVGAAVALPAAMLSIKAVSLTTKLAVMGVGDAISAGFGDNAKDAKKALDKLSGETRKFAGEVVALKEPISSLQKSVSSRFFAPLVGEIQPLADRYIPLLRAEMGDLSGDIGGFAQATAQAAGQASVMNGVRELFRGTGVAVSELRGAVGPLTAAFGALIQSTAPQLPSIAAGLRNAAVAASEFVTNAVNSGAVMNAFEKGKKTLQDLGGILGNVGGILYRVFTAANQGGSTLLTNLRELTGQANDFLKSAQGFGALTAIFGTLGSVGDALRTGLGAVLPALAQSIQVMGPALAGLAGPAGQLVVAIAPLLPIVAGLAAQVVTALTPAIATLANFLSQNEGAVKALVVTLIAYRGVMLAASAVTAVQGAGGLLKYLTTTKLVAAATKAWAAVQVVMNAILTANPIGLVVAALALLAGAIYLAWTRSETFRKIVTAAWEGIKAAALAVANWFMTKALPVLKAVWDGIAAGATWLWQKVLRPVFSAWVAYFKNVVAPVATWLWKNIVTPVFNGIGWVVKAGIAVAQLAIAVAVAYWKNVLAPTAMWLWKNVIMPVFNGIKAVVQTNIAVVRSVLSAVTSFIRGPVASAFTWWWRNIVTPVFNGVRTVISSVWEKGIKPVFNALKGFVLDTLPKAFKTGTDGIASAWKKVQEAARVPVQFVVNRVINPLIGGFNKVAGAFGTPKIDPIQGFDAGGQIPGRPSLRDNMLAAVGGAGSLLKVASGEFITNTASTLANLPLLRVVNAKRGRVTRDDIDPVLDGFDRGGRVGDGLGDFFGSVVRGFQGVGGFVTNPGKTLSKLANDMLSKIPGGGSIRNVLTGMGRKVIDGVKDFFQKFMGGGILGGGTPGGNWRWMQQAIGARFPGLNLISGFRPGARTLSGNQSYHALGRAVDYPPHRGLAAWIKATYGARTKELITPWQDLNLNNGRPHTYTGAVWNQHNFAGGNAHVHWAAQDGGLVGPNSGLAQVARADFGSVTLRQGWNLIQNATGKPEPLATPSGRVEALLEAILDATESNPRQFARAMGGTSAGLLRTARRM